MTQASRKCALLYVGYSLKVDTGRLIHARKRGSHGSTSMTPKAKGTELRENHLMVGEGSFLGRGQKSLANWLELRETESSRMSAGGQPYRGRGHETRGKPTWQAPPSQRGPLGIRTHIMPAHPITVVHAPEDPGNHRESQPGSTTCSWLHSRSIQSGLIGISGTRRPLG